ncbi:hypothetical protein AAZX31_02G009400 [Glycine max]|uniref:Uncharacterized protein n=2 Tax=Glycine subgen. Soja TaxID=1462606 RepID=C6T5J0_SOYBN|nr:NPR1 interacting domain-containing protein [Glycine max]XP_028192488.1 protein NIM1-INTERACTING 1-like [Glycine soja]ACU17012.1 unknown [Glycine max]KAG4917219.1 hypothetical protein JHK87_054776 [Glycine soja]KAG5078792.1 hypothetical protein JHK86_002857 [Glycine max]KAH1058184.1 hypothetical protein GYH30_002643 [Glycine max]KAH1259802.1 hypothetical protein GmHk_02G003090 [Glycine max]|eukprot:NP_001238003.1 NPR1 interacting domain-containing protein [Glycine max]
MGESNSNKKRKLICREEEHEEEEETKMETFFALVRNFRDTRDRWMGLRSGDRKSKRGKIITAKEENIVWKPTFQLEDFADEQARCRNSLEPSASSQSKNCDKEDAAEKGIDLSLSL